MTGASSLADSARRFFKTPKGLLLLIFIVLLAIAVPAEGVRTVAPGLAAAVALAAAIDVENIQIGRAVKVADHKLRPNLAPVWPAAKLGIELGLREDLNDSD